MKKIIVLVLDGFGIGAMDDVLKVRPQDQGANTALHIIKQGNIKLPVLESLGLVNAMNQKVPNMQISNQANAGRAKLAHYGADTFFGHQEIMGTNPQKPLRMAFKEVIDEVEDALLKVGYPVKRIKKGQAELLTIKEEIYIGDNLETDLGQVYNVTTSFDYVSFEHAKKVAQVVRNVVKVARVIVFGGEGVSKDDLRNAIETKKDTFIGVNAPKSNVYNKHYMVEHMGYGVDHQVQVHNVLFREKHVQTAFIGKVADICPNPHGDSFPMVPTDQVMKKTIQAIKEDKYGFICSNVQETDLAGHAESVQTYIKRLKTVEEYLPTLLKELTEEDVLIVMADHGNDPTVGHSKHTRENVPLLVYKKGITGKTIGTRETLADVGASVADFFGTSLSFGQSFLGQLDK